MRKKLLFCSALLLSASLAGCGYNDDNVRETVPALPEQCTNTYECFVGSTGGQCVAGHCLRPCTNFEDCEEGSMCEDGLCRHIIDCPTKDVNGSKCLEVLSITPKKTWTRVLGENVQETQETIAKRSNVYPNDFTSSKFTFQLPKRSLTGGLNYSLVMMAALTYIALENEASSALMKCLMPSEKKDDQCPEKCEYEAAEDVNPQNYQIRFNEELAPLIKMDNSLITEVCEGAMSDEKGLGKYWKDDIKKANLETYMDRFKDSVDCAHARLLWDTLGKVKNMIGSMTMTNLDNSPLATAMYWVNDLLDDGMANQRDTKIDVTTTITLPTISSPNNIQTHIVSIHQNICKNVMYGLLQNTATNILKNSSINLVKCLTNENLVPNLINNGLDTIKQYNHKPTLEGLILTLGEIMESEDTTMQASFRDVDAMVEALGDPTWIWLTTNLYQELNIIENTDSNNFKNHSLLLQVQYTGKASGITNGNITLNGYQNTDITNENNNPTLTDNNLKPSTTMDYARNHDSNLVLLSSNLADTNTMTKTHEFYIHPKVADDATSNAVCGGIVLDVSAIKGYVVLTDQDIRDKSGHALVMDKK